MSAHTPGPWLTANAGLLIVSSKNEPLAKVWEAPPGRENARLMAAAPELLAALQKIRDYHVNHHVLHEIDAAIFKATGIQP